MRAAAILEPRHEPALPPGFAEFYAAHYDFAWRCAMRLGVPASDVEDVVQECFVVALRRFDRFNPRGRARPSTWLFAILRNVQRNHARSARRRAARLELIARESETESPGGIDADGRLAWRLLDEFLATLDADKRAAFVLAEIEGMTGPELAHALELNLNTANSRVRAAKLAFARHFDASSEREVARVALTRSAKVRAPEAAVRRGLPAIVVIAGSKLPVAAGVGLLGAKWLAGVIFAAASLGAVAIVASAQPAGAPASAPAASPNAELAAAELAQPSARIDAKPNSERVAEALAEPAPTPTPKPKPRPEPTPLERLGKARAALVDQRPAQALAEVEGREFPAELEARRVAVEIAALCRLDRQALAERRAAAWRAEHPDDPTATELREVCGSE